MGVLHLHLDYSLISYSIPFKAHIGHHLNCPGEECSFRVQQLATALMGHCLVMCVSCLLNTLSEKGFLWAARKHSKGGKNSSSSTGRLTLIDVQKAVSCIVVAFQKLLALFLRLSFHSCYCSLGGSNSNSICSRAAAKLLCFISQSGRSSSTGDDGGAMCTNSRSSIHTIIYGVNIV